MTPLDRLVRERIAIEGPIPYATVIELALYHPEHGFYSRGGVAGRRGDFLTSPEVGPLFGGLVAEALDREWDRCGRPDEFVMVDAGAGPGTLARSIGAAEPRCREALVHVAVERSEAQRAQHPDGIRSVGAMPTGPVTGLVFANELLDNLTFQPVLRVDGEWVDAVVEVRDGRLVTGPGPAAADGPDDGTDGFIAQRAAARWLDEALTVLERGRVIVVDYARTSGADVEVRTYRGHERGGDPLADLGSQDITVDVDLEQLARRIRRPDSVTTQAEWLQTLGVEALVDEGRDQWNAGAAGGGLDALLGRSRIREAEALCDPDGLGSFTVAQWVVG
ncbi:MAG: hypothetical protein HKN01_00750 [Acidimicrobiia bacterium]|nr:hypothetical protein [Acidimicrobiia bacterium]